MGADPGSLSRSFAGTGGRTYGLFPLFRLPGSPWFRRSGYGEDLPRHRRADRGLSPFLSAAGRSTAALRKGDGGDLLRHCREMCAAHQKNVAPSGERGLRPGRAYPRRMTKNGRMFFASVTAFHYTCLHRFCQPTKRQNPYPFPKKHPPQIRFPPGVRRCIQQMLFFRFPGGFNLPKVGF